MLPGQWFGPFAGTRTGQVILELDQVGMQVRGAATVYTDDPQFPVTFTSVTAGIDDKAVDQRMPIFPIDPDNGEPVPWPHISSRFPGVEMAPYVDTKWRLSGGTLYISWTSDLVPSHGLAVLTRGAPETPSTREALPIMSWEQFKQEMASLEPYRFIFRGQSHNTWRLRTYFHRTGRADLRRFMKVDIQEVHRHLSGMTSHVFDLNNPSDNGAFYTLLQHHGYPTPLLDWTQSPYVAAYFAFRGVAKCDRVDTKKVRIFAFDAKEWQTNFRQLQRITPARRHFSIFNPLAINNPRLVPQQALLTISNVDDIEGYIEEREREQGRTFLYVIDLPCSERQQAMQELSIMGITAGSLFPGLDGACEQMRERFFDL